MKAQSTAPNPELLGKARSLRSSSFFVGTSDLALFTGKQAIFLTLTGLKPVSEVASAHWVATAGGRHTVPDDPDLVAQFLTSLGLVSHIKVREAWTTAVVALQPKLLDDFHHARGAIEVGRLFGYPESAIAGFARGDLLSDDEQTRLEHEAGLADYPSPFRFSRHNWQEELALVRRWRQVLEQYSLLQL